MYPVQITDRACRLLILACMSWAALACTTVAEKEKVDSNMLVDLKYQKQNAEGLVVRLRSAHAETSSEYREAQLLYDDARRWYNAYIGQVLDDFTFDRKADLSPSASKASAAAERFQAYVLAHTKTNTRAVPIAIAAALFTAASELYKAYEKRSEDKRRAIAEQIEPEVKWQEWSAIGAPPKVQ